MEPSETLHTKPSRKVLLAHLADWQPFAMIPRLLRQAGFSANALGPPSSLVGRSRYTERRIETGKTAAEVLAQLKDHLLREGETYARVIFCDDSILHAIHRTRDPEWLRWLPVQTWERFDILLSKSLQVRAGGQAGLQVPQSRHCSDPDAVRQAAVEIGFPLFVKLDGGSGGRMAFRAGSLKDVQTTLDKGFLRYPVTVQSFIEGKVGCTSIVYAKGIPLSMLHSIKCKTHPGPYGPSTARTFQASPGAEALVRGFGEITRFDGLAGIDWIEGSTNGEITFLEFNPRPISCVHLGPLCGQDPASVIGGWLTGIHQMAPPQKPFTKTLYLYPKDIVRCLHVDFRGLRNWVSPFVPHDIPWNDPPVLATLTRQMAGEGVKAFRNKCQGTVEGWRKRLRS